MPLSLPRPRHAVLAVLLAAGAPAMLMYLDNAGGQDQ